jgi:chorismate mutase
MSTSPATVTATTTVAAVATAPAPAAAAAAAAATVPAPMTAPRPAPHPTPHPSAASDPADPPTPACESGGESRDEPRGVSGGRARIDALDAELIELIRRRVAVSAEIQSARISTGGRRLDLRRETEVIGRYTQALGRPGTAVAMALLELGRGRV